VSNRFWISWEEPGEDPRPLNWPLPASIPHWWCSGYGDDTMQICAVVDVDGDAEAAENEVRRHWHPLSWRFNEPKGETAEAWMPSGGRFPVKGAKP